MAEVKTIKDVDEKTWAEFKSLAARNSLKLGVLFKIMLRDYEKNSKVFWKTILEGEKILSDKEAEEISEVIKHLRKEKGFR